MSECLVRVRTISLEQYGSSQTPLEGCRSQAFLGALPANPCRVKRGLNDGLATTTEMIALVQLQHLASGMGKEWII